jgi:hypothetical protein
VRQQRRADGSVRRVQQPSQRAGEPARRVALNPGSALPAVIKSEKQSADAILAVVSVS